MIPVSQNSVVSNRKELLRIIIWYYIVQTCITVLHRCVHMYDFIQQTVTEFVCELFVSVPFICDYFKSTVTSSHFLRTAALKKKIILKNFISFKWASVPKLSVVGVGSLPETIILKKGEKLCPWAAFPYSAGANVFSFLMAGAAGTCANHNGRMSFHFKKILV